MIHNLKTFDLEFEKKNTPAYLSMKHIFIK